MQSRYILDNRLIFHFLCCALGLDKAAVLITVISVTGSSMRNPGAHMAVCDDGSHVGSLSGGCIEQAVVSEALEVSRDGRARIVRFGEGSPYLDIKLPCGGGLDVHFMPIFETDVPMRCLEAIIERKPFSISLPIDRGDLEFSNAVKRNQEIIEQADGAIMVAHIPVAKILIVGHGAATSSVARLSREMQFDVQVLTSDRLLADNLAKDRFDAEFLKTPNETDAIASDRWTAFVFLFHDHDWEGALMANALAQPYFYFGAMGGRRAHEARKQRLQLMGVNDAAISSIRAPIGLFHSSRDPDSLALSSLAEITQAYHAKL